MGEKIVELEVILLGGRDVASPTVYQATQGWNGKFVFLMVVFVGFAVVGYTVWSQSPVLSVLLMGFFGGGALLFLVVMLRGNLTLRVDSEGVTLAVHPCAGRCRGGLCLGRTSRRSFFLSKSPVSMGRAA
jgi:hypothetical protein